MAQAKANMSGSRVEVLDLDQVHEDPHNARQVFDKAKLEQLAESIKAQGILQSPIVRVVHVEAGGKTYDQFQLIDGHRRVRAARLAGLKQIRVEVREDLDDKQAALAAATANLQREDLTPYEQARAFKTAIDLGMAKKELCERAGIVFNTLKARLQLLELPEPVARTVGLNGFTQGAAQTLLPLAKHPVLLEAVREDLVKAEEVPLQRDMGEFIQRSLKNRKLAIKAQDVERSWEIRGIEARAAKEFPHIQVPTSWGRGTETLIVDVPGLRKKAEEWRKADLAERKKEEAKYRGSSGGHGGGMSEAAKQADRLKRATRQHQVSLMAKHLAGVKKFGEDLQRRIYQDYLQRLGQVAPSLIDQEAIDQLMGEKLLSNGSPNGAIVEKLWKKDRAQLDRFLAAMLYMANKDYQTKIVKKEDVARMTTGTTWQHAEAEAREALKAKEKAKAAKKALTKASKDEPAWKKRSDAAIKGYDRAFRQKPKPAPAPAAPAPPKGKKSAQELLKEAKAAKKVAQAAKDKATAGKVKLTPKAKVATSAPTQQASLPAAAAPERPAAVDMAAPSETTQRLQELARREHANPGVEASAGVQA